MTNYLAVWLFLLIALALGLDLYFGWGGTLYLLRKLFDLVGVLAFWR